MPYMNNDLKISWGKRPCYAKGVEAWFHTWEYYAEPVEGGLTYGSHPPGQFSRCYAIVEYEDGTVDRVEPIFIKFKEGT